MSQSAAQAVCYLHALKLTPSAAIDSLDMTLSGIEILSLFAHYFPRELKTLSSLEVALPTFMKLVSERLFPLNEFVLDEWQEYGSFNQIPLVAVNDDWWEREKEDQDIFTSAVISGAGISGPDTWMNFPAINYKKLAKLSTGALRHLPDGVRFVFHCTGNAWLDVSQEELDYTTDFWDIETCDNLAAIWKDAKPILMRSNRVHRYVQEHPALAFKVSELVAQCLVKPRPKPAPEPEAQTLVRVLV